MSDYSAEKVGVIWGGILLTSVALMVPMTIMVNHYNDTERDRANACTGAHGVYVQGKCVWSTVQP